MNCLLELYSLDELFALGEFEFSIFVVWLLSDNSFEVA